MSRKYLGGLLLVAIAIVVAVLVHLLMESSARIIGGSPPDLGVGVAPDPHVQIVFQNPMNVASLTDSTFQLLQGDQQVPARISYNPADNTATVDASGPLAYSTRYTVHVVGGADGVRSAYFGRRLSSDFSFSFTTAASPLTGPGGPILLIGSAARPFSTYYPEILRAEGLNEFATADIATLSAGQLSAYRLLVLGQMPLTSEQTSMLGDFVRGGGNLIAMRPDARLAPLLGLRPGGKPVSDAYLKIDNTTEAGAALTNTPIQYHGAADAYQLDGATALAGLYSASDAPLPNPAVTLNAVGDKGGQAAAFTFDLAQSVVLTRQGNPAWSGQHGDGQTVGRSDDEMIGPAKPPWLDWTKLAIPQADEQQRLLANLIHRMMLPGLPLPRFWYLPDGAKAIVIMTGDDHDNAGSPGRWRHFIAEGTTGGKPIMGTAYIFPGRNLHDKVLAPFVAKGFEVALHVDICPGPIFGDQDDIPIDWKSYAQLDSRFSDQLAIFNKMYPSIPSPITNRTHGVVWSDYDSQPQVEYQHNIRLDANYYYWPPSWINDRPGMFTGSGMPMRFATIDGKMIDCFQESTLITDESDESQEYFVDALLNLATGPAEAYGAFGVNAHNDEVASVTADATIASARTHEVPIITAERLLNFIDARDNSSFDAIQWDAAARTLSFRLTIAVNGDGLEAMVPLQDGSGHTLATLSIDGAPVQFTRELIKGIYYARFPAAGGLAAPHRTGLVKAQYSTEAVATNRITLTPAPSSAGVSIDSAVSAAFHDAIDPKSLSFILKDANGGIVPANAVFNAESRTATLTPREVLRNGFTYTAVVAALDSGGRPAGPCAWPFTTAAAATSARPYSFWTDADAPAIPSTDDAKSTEVGVQFTTDVPGVVTGVRFYKGPLNVGPHVGRVWNTEGEKLAQADFAGETASGWQTVIFSQPVAIMPGKIYIASYHANEGHYAVTAGFFAQRGVHNGPIHLLANDVAAGGNGVFAVADRNANNEIGRATNFPRQTYRASNYWVDILFVPEAHRQTVTDAGK